MISAPAVRTARRLTGIAVLALLGGCATTPGAYRLAEKDPLEKANRVVWGVNRAADKVVIRPATKVYMAVAPKPARQGITNFFANLDEPWSFINNLLQGKPKRAGQNLARFLVNSTIGLAGFLDPATRFKIPDNYEDLGQTFAVWGVNGGPYVMLPLLGPSTMRDGIGTGIGFYANPVNIALQQWHHARWPKLGYRAAQVIDARSELIESGGDAFLETSLDPYAAARSAYLQRRTAAIADQENSLDAGPPDAPADMSDAAAGPPDPPAQADAAAPATAPAAPGTLTSQPPASDAAAPPSSSPDQPAAPPRP